MISPSIYRELRGRSTVSNIILGAICIEVVFEVIVLSEIMREKRKPYCLSAWVLEEGEQGRWRREKENQECSCKETEAPAS